MKLFQTVSIVIAFSSPVLPHPNSLCGPESLLVICQKFGVKTNLDELRKLSDCREQGTTMLGLYQASQKKGLYAVGMKIGVDDLAKRQVLAIAHLWNNHFVVVEGTGSETLIVTDPPNKSRAVLKEEFQNIYSGFALLISKNRNIFPRIKISGPDIRFDEYVSSLGIIEEGTKVERIFKFRNTGKTDLEILNVRATCGCTAAVSTERNIKPKGSGEIKVTFDTTGRRGLQNHKIYVRTNDPVTPIVQLQIQGRIKSGLTFSSINIAFGDIKKGTTPNREMFIIDRTGENIKITRVESYPEFLTATLSSVTDSPYHVHKILVTVSSGTPLCRMEGKVTIYTTDKKCSKIEIPVSANVIGDIEFRPCMLFFGYVKKGETSSDTITIFTTGTNPLKIKKVESDIPWVSTDFDTIQEGLEYAISATLSNEAQTGGCIKGFVIVSTNSSDQPEIKIPVYALVEK